jgi:hypothetical protein
MNKIKTILWAIDAKAQDLDARHWQRMLRYADQYARRGRHHRGRRGWVPVPEQMDATTLILWARRELNNWYKTLEYDGIGAAIALEY